MVAERYERYRPGYPDEVVDRVLAGLGDARNLTALEIGAGTGKATRAFASRGVRIRAIEPDHQMCALLAEVTDRETVTICEGTFEDLEPDPSVDLVYAAAAWHWTDPATRWTRAARWLRPGGVVAALGGPVDLTDEVLLEQVRRVVSPFVGDESIPGTDDDHDVTGIRWPGTELLAAPDFRRMEQHESTLHYRMNADDFVGLASTTSAYLLLDEATRSDLLARIRALLPEWVQVRRDLTVHRAIRT